MKLKLTNLIQLFLSVTLIIIFLWIKGTPSEGNILKYKLNQIINEVDYTRYTVKAAMLLNKMQTKQNANKIVLVNIRDSKYTLESDKISNIYKIIQKIINKLLKGNPKIIASDIIITHPITELAKDIEDVIHKNILSDPQTLNLLEKYDESFKDTIAKNNIILPILQTSGYIQYGKLPKPIIKVQKDNYPLYNIHGYIANYKGLQDSAKYSGFTNTFVTNIYANNKHPLLVRNNKDVYPSLALAIAMQLFPDRKIKINTTRVGQHIFVRSINFGSQIIPTGIASDIYTPFNQGVFAPKQITVKNLLSDEFDLSSLDNAIIILNTNLDHLGNNFDTLQTKYNINAQISMLNSILSDIYLYSPYWGKLLTLYLILSFGIIITLCFNLLSTGLSLIIIFSLYSLLMMTNFFAFYYAHIVLNISTPIILGLLLILINMIFSWLFEAHRKMYIRNFFAQYVPPAYLNILLDNPNAYGFEGKSEDLTVLFADIRNFTGISENLDASGVKNILNKFFTPMTSVILKNGGTVDKYVGDMVMAFFGAPVANSNHREYALNCALEMLAYTKKMRKTFIAQGLPPIDLSIGLNSGMMNVGDMGSEFRRSYTVIGDAVNLGSRIQSITAYYGVKLLVGSNTCKDQTKFVFRMIDKVKLKGKTESETIYEVVGRTKSTREYVIQEVNEHKQALDAYFAQDWDLAIHLFATLADKFPNYKVYSIFLERAQNYKIHNPPKDWDGSHTFTEK